MCPLALPLSPRLTQKYKYHPEQGEEASHRNGEEHKHSQVES